MSTGNCPKCGGFEWIGDNYGMTCQKCGFNRGMGENARARQCNHEFQDDPTGDGQTCIWCEAWRRKPIFAGP